MFVSVCLQLFVKAGLLQNCSCTVALPPSGHVGGPFLSKGDHNTSGWRRARLFVCWEGGVCVCVMEMRRRGHIIQQQLTRSLLRSISISHTDAVGKIRQFVSPNSNHSEEGRREAGVC